MISKYVPIPKEETYILIRRAQAGDEEAKTLLVQQNTGLVKKIAMKFVSGDHELEDLVQIGYMGLLKAVEKFNAEYDVMFSTYAVPMIMGEIKRFFRDHGKIKASRALKTDIYTLKQIQERFVTSEGRMPRISQIAEEMGISSERVLEIIEAQDILSSVASLDDLLVWQNYKQYPGAESPEHQVDVIVMKEEIAALKEKERLVILLRYYRDMTQQQIAERLGISQVQVSRLERKALTKIRQNLSEIMI